MWSVTARLPARGVAAAEVSLSLRRVFLEDGSRVYLALTLLVGPAPRCTSSLAKISARSCARLFSRVRTSPTVSGGDAGENGRFGARGGYCSCNEKDLLRMHARAFSRPVKQRGHLAPQTSCNRVQRCLTVNDRWCVAPINTEEVRALSACEAAFGSCCVVGVSIVSHVGIFLATLFGVHMLLISSWGEQFFFFQVCLWHRPNGGSFSRT